MQQYHHLLRDVIANGVDKSDRTGVGIRSVFGRQVRFDLTAGFPLLTTKRVHVKSVVYELLWFLSGATNNQWLNAQGVTIWDEWAAPDGELGPIYGGSWRSWPARTPQHRSAASSSRASAATDSRPSWCPHDPGSPRARMSDETPPGHGLACHAFISWMGGVSAVYSQVQ
jgi:thymidylate synthase